MEQKTLGRRIREERLKLNLTQEKLAEDVDLSMAYIGQIERGERSLTLDNLVAVANRLGVTVDYLLSDSITAKDDAEYLILRQLLNGRTKEERALAVNMVKLMFGYLDRSLLTTAVLLAKEQHPGRVRPGCFVPGCPERSV